MYILMKVLCTGPWSRCGGRSLGTPHSHTTHRTVSAVPRGIQACADSPCSRRGISAVQQAEPRSWKSPDRTGHSVQQQHNLVERRALLLQMVACSLFAGSSQAASTMGPPVIRPDLAPDQTTYNAADEDLRQAAAMLQRGLNAPSLADEEAAWSAVIDTYGRSTAPWADDVVGRALGNRGNARSRQGRLSAALDDYAAAMARCPWSVDPVLNRGVALEALGRYEEAIADYRAVLAVAPDDPSAWNNLGNASAGAGRWGDAVEYYGKAATLAPTFSFAAANRALALYQLGQRDPAIREMRTLLRRYPDFPDMRAALAAALWGVGKEGDAETQWDRVEDGRYKDMNWVRTQRRWPPALADALQAFLTLSSAAPAV